MEKRDIWERIMSKGEQIYGELPPLLRFILSPLVFALYVTLVALMVVAALIYLVVGLMLNISTGDSRWLCGRRNFPGESQLYDD